MCPKKNEDTEIEWICYYCRQSLGIGSRTEGSRLGKCPRCGREQVGSGVTIMTKETKNLLRETERRLKDARRSN